MNYKKVLRLKQFDIYISFYYYDNSNNTLLDESNNKLNDDLPFILYFVYYIQKVF